MCMRDDSGVQDLRFVRAQMREAPLFSVFPNSSNSTLIIVLIREILYFRDSFKAMIHLVKKRIENRKNIKQ